LNIPLGLKIKKVKHRKIAEIQDIIVEKLYKYFENAVLHGETAIWRCYSGNRFSEDIDAYIQKQEEKLSAFFDELKKEVVSL